MKKTILLLAFCTSHSCFSQDNPDTEMQRLNRMGDSLYKERLARDSAYKVKMENMIRDVKRDVEESKQKEIQGVVDKMLKDREKEKWRRRRDLILAAGIAGLIATITIKLLRKRRENIKSS
jgi:hypothetical protein